MGIDVRRRCFIGLLAGAAGWPLAAAAQQKTMPVIGFLRTGSSAGADHLLAAFRRGLAELGYIEGHNLVIEYRWAENQRNRLVDMAADLVHQNVAVIVASGGPPAAFAARAVTTTIPIVFTSVGNPVELGLVASLARPGGNITGGDWTLTSELDTKRLELLHELLPALVPIGVLVNSNRKDYARQVDAIRSAAQVMKVEPVLLGVSGDADLENAFTALSQKHLGALLVTADPLFDNRREDLVQLARRFRVPAIYQWRQFVDAGGLMSYGASLPDAYHHAGVYAGRILNGAKATELPVEQPTRFELVINLKTARLLGLTVPQSLLGRADEVIE